MTQLLFRDVLLNRCARETKYHLENNIPSEILLIVDYASRHPPLIGDLYPQSKAGFLPPSITSLIQPMDQGAIAAFQADDLRRTFALAVATPEEEGHREDPDASLEGSQHL